jgi:molybdate transport system ATP-binding protein
MEHTLLQVKGLTIQLSGKTVLNDVSFEVKEGECLAVIGLSGSGKSTLIKVLSGNYFSKGSVKFQTKNGHPSVISISQQHHFKNLSNTSSFYYQQRFNSIDSEDAVMVNDVLKNICSDEDALAETLELLGIEHIRYTRLIQLSNGEHKRFQLAKAILQKADWLLLDSPYTGLDIKARKLLNRIIDKLVAKGIHVLMVTDAYTEMPSAITHVAVLEDGKLKDKICSKEFVNKRNFLVKKNTFPSFNIKAAEEVTPAYDYDEFAVAIKMINTNIIYNNRKILDNINWKVNKGECWSVSGHNGSGKSTLLSLITGDNPQAFANEIYLFDRKKGSGESIWDIKQKIGYVSPELHHYFEASCSCFDVVASGLFDTIGLFKQLSKGQTELVKKWMLLLQINKFEKRLLKQLSNGEQRLVLLVRALVKNPPLLILDEPCQGLDAQVTGKFIALINDICVALKKTLVYVSHYESEIPQCVTYTLKLDHGRIAA